MNQIHVYDLQFFKTDESGNNIVNKDGSTKLFYAPNLDLILNDFADYVNDGDLEEIK